MSDQLPGPEQQRVGRDNGAQFEQTFRGMPKALRASNPAKGRKDFADVAGLLQVLGITDVEAAVGVLAEYFPRSAAAADKQRFVLRHLLSAERLSDAPEYPRRGD